MPVFFIQTAVEGSRLQQQSSWARVACAVAGGCLLLVVFSGLWITQVTHSGWCNDESAHIPAGLYHLETGLMDSYRVNPPLPRMIAALPLLVDQPMIQWQTYASAYARSEYRFADAWVSDNQSIIPRQLLISRATMLLFFGLGLWSIVRWAQDLYGNTSAWLAAAMWCFNPEIITHSAVVAPDLPAAASGLFCGYHFWRWLKLESRPMSWTVAATLALAILCKFSWLFLMGLLPMVVWAYDWWRCKGGLKRGALDLSTQPLAPTPSPRSWARGASFLSWQFSPFDQVAIRDALRLIGTFSLTLLLVNWCYGFDGSGTRLGDYHFISRALTGMDVAMFQTGNRFEGGPLGVIPVPLPKQMLLGLDYLKWEFERGFPSYLNGVWKERGWWYFYLDALVIKTPLGYLMLIGLGVGTWIWASIRGIAKAGEWLPLFIAIIFLAQVSSQTGFTHHVRYVLPVYGFVFLLASRIMIVLPRWKGPTLAVVCLAGIVVYQVFHPGLSHAFFNGLVGGPNHGWRHLSFSNVDWGQSTYRMVEWIESHPEHRPITVVFAAPIGEPGKLVDSLPDVTASMDWRHRINPVSTKPAKSGWVLMSSYQLTLPENAYFHDQPIVQQPYPDVLLFHVTDEQLKDPQ